MLSGKLYGIRGLTEKTCLDSTVFQFACILSHLRNAVNVHYSTCMAKRIPVMSWVTLILFGLCVCVLLFADFGKGGSLVVDSLLDFGHVPLFVLVTAVVLRVLEPGGWLKADVQTYVRAFALSVFFGVSSEIVQHFMPGRSFQLGDIVRDAAGALAFVLLAYRHKRPMRPQRRAAIAGIACLAVLGAFAPVVSAASDELRARRDFPLLSSFETAFEMKRWVIKEGSSQRVRMHATHGLYSLEVRLEPGTYPGVTLDFPPRDWRGFDALAFDVHVGGPSPLPLTVRINDLEHNEEYTDRYNKTFVLGPGANHVVIDLAEVKRAPRGRAMDMGRMALVCLFSYRLKEPRTIYLDNVRLQAGLDASTARGTPP